MAGFNSPTRPDNGNTSSHPLTMQFGVCNCRINQDISIEGEREDFGMRKAHHYRDNNRHGQRDDRWPLAGGDRTRQFDDSLRQWQHKASAHKTAHTNLALALSGRTGRSRIASPSDLGEHNGQKYLQTHWRAARSVAHGSIAREPSPVALIKINLAT